MKENRFLADNFLFRRLTSVCVHRKRWRKTQVPSWNKIFAKCCNCQSIYGRVTVQFVKVAAFLIIGVWVVDIFSLNENIKLSPKLAIIQRQNKYLHTCTLLTLWRPSSSVCTRYNMIQQGAQLCRHVWISKLGWRNSSLDIWRSNSLTVINKLSSDSYRANLHHFSMHSMQRLAHN